jgi:YD repeat-containing protein
MGSDSIETFTYDAAGNLTQQLKGDGGIKL